jgi:N-acyl-L-homoserine lactone synthetase
MVLVSSSRQSHSTSDRKHSSNSFSASISRLLDKIDCRRADSAEEREAIFRLRYDAYMREDAIVANSTKKFSDSFDESENAYIFGLYIQGELASSLRLHVASKEHPEFPSLEVFPEYLYPELEAGKILIDTTRLVVDEKLSRLHRGLPYATVRVCMLAGEYFGADDMLAAVRAEHQAFYRRAFNHQVVCKPRPYPELTKPICLMTLDLPSAAEGLRQRYPFFHSTVAERRKLFERPPQAVAQSNREAASLQPPSELPETDSPFVESEPVDFPPGLPFFKPAVS